MRQVRRFVASSRGPGPNRARQQVGRVGLEHQAIFGYPRNQIAQVQAPVEVQAVATFYTMYNVIEPMGRYHIQVCHNISCTLLGAENLLVHLEKVLGIKPGETTVDKKFSMSTVECLGSCGTAPMMQINDDYFESLTIEKVEKILMSYR